VLWVQALEKWCSSTWEWKNQPRILDCPFDFI